MLGVKREVLLKLIIEGYVPTKRAAGVTLLAVESLTPTVRLRAKKLAGEIE